MADAAHDAERETVLEVDARRRVTLGRLGHQDHRRYLANEEPDGTIVLRPAIVITELEAQYLRNQSLVARVAANRSDPSRLVRRKRG